MAPMSVEVGNIFAQIFELDDSISIPDSDFISWADKTYGLSDLRDGRPHREYHNLGMKLNAIVFPVIITAILLAIIQCRTPSVLHAAAYIAWIYTGSIVYLLFTIYGWAYWAPGYMQRAHRFVFFVAIPSTAFGVVVACRDLYGRFLSCA